jgi:hypothetical protein
MEKKIARLGSSSAGSHTNIFPKLDEWAGYVLERIAQRAYSQRAHLSRISFLNS